MLSLSIYSSSTASTAKRSTAKHSTARAQRNHPWTKQQSKYVPIRVHTRYQKRRKRGMHVYVHACGASGLFSWSMELLALASRLFAPKMLDHLRALRTSVISFHSPGERAQRAKPPATRSALLSIIEIMWHVCIGMIFPFIGFELKYHLITIYRYLDR